MSVEINIDTNTLNVLQHGAEYDNLLYFDFLDYPEDGIIAVESETETWNVNGVPLTLVEITIGGKRSYMPKVVLFGPSQIEFTSRTQTMVYGNPFSVIDGHLECAVDAVGAGRVLFESFLENYTYFDTNPILLSQDKKMFVSSFIPTEPIDEVQEIKLWGVPVKAYRIGEKWYLGFSEGTGYVTPDLDCWLIAACSEQAGAYDFLSVQNDLTTEFANGFTISIDGFCYEILGQTNCEGSINLSSFNSHSDCDVCLDANNANCWLLSPCPGSYAGYIIVDNNMRWYYDNNRIVKYNDICYSVEGRIRCNDFSITIPNSVGYLNCKACDDAVSPPSTPEPVVYSTTPYSTTIGNTTGTPSSYVAYNTTYDSYKPSINYSATGCYLIEDCQTGIQMTVKIKIGHKVGQTIKIKDKCYKVLGIAECDNVQSVSSWTEHGSCQNCLESDGGDDECWLITNCVNPNSTKIVSNNLGDYIGKYIIAFKSAWKVEGRVPCKEECYDCKHGDVYEESLDVDTIRAFSSCKDALDWIPADQQILHEDDQSYFILTPCDESVYLLQKCEYVTFNPFVPTQSEPVVSQYAPTPITKCALLVEPCTVGFIGAATGSPDALLNIFPKMYINIEEGSIVGNPRGQIISIVDSYGKTMCVRIINIVESVYAEDVTFIKSYGFCGINSRNLGCRTRCQQCQSENNLPYVY